MEVRLRSRLLVSMPGLFQRGPLLQSLVGVVTGRIGLIVLVGKADPDLRFF